MTNKQILLDALDEQAKAKKKEFDHTTLLLTQLPEGSPLRLFAVDALEKINNILELISSARDAVYQEADNALNLLGKLVDVTNEYQKYLEGGPQ